MVNLMEKRKDLNGQGDVTVGAGNTNLLYKEVSTFQKQIQCFTIFTAKMEKIYTALYQIPWIKYYYNEEN